MYLRPAWAHSETLSQQRQFHLAWFCVKRLSHLGEVLPWSHSHLLFTVCHLYIHVCVRCVSVYRICRRVSLCVCELVVGIGHLPNHSRFRCFRKRILLNLQLTNLARLAGQQAAGTLLSLHHNAEVTGTIATISARDTNTRPHLCTSSTLPTESSFPDPRFSHFLK